MKTDTDNQNALEISDLTEMLQDSRRAIADLRLLVIRVSRAATTDQKTVLVEHANRIAKAHGVTANILREYTEEQSTPGIRDK